MGLMTCVDCKKKFSDRIDSCPHCGCPKSASVTRNRSTNPAEIEPKKVNVAAIVLCIIAVLLMMLVAVAVYFISVFETPVDAAGKTEPTNGSSTPVSNAAPAPIITYDVMDIIITANSSSGVGDVFSEMNTNHKYKIHDNDIGDHYTVNYKAIGGVGVISTNAYIGEDGHYHSSGDVYGPIEDCWYSVTLPDGTHGFVWGGPNAMYVDEIYN